MLIGTMDEPPSRQEAEAFLGRWVAGLGPRLDWFAEELRARGGPDLAPSTNLLRPLLEFVVGHVGEEREVDPVPEWFGDPHRRYGWTGYGAALVEGLIAFVDHLYQRHEGGVAWVVDNDSRSGHFRQPVPERLGLAPAWTQVIGSVGSVQSGLHGLDRLQNVVENTLGFLDQLDRAEAAGSEPPGVRVEVTPVDLAEWNYQVSIDEEVVADLEPEVYADLEDRLAGIPGVRAAMFEDREVCLLNAEPHVKQEALQAGVQEVVQEAAGRAT